MLSVSFAPRGTTLATTSADGKLRLWDVKSRKLIGTPLAGSDAASWGVFLPDGKHVISVYSSGVGTIWNLDPAAWAARACDVAHRDLTRVEWSTYLPDTRYRSVCK